jgi:hypothetical protein
MQPDKNSNQAQQSVDTPATKEKPEDLQIKKNPNPRANENIDEGRKKDSPQNTDGPGSEITDGEDG